MFLEKPRDVALPALSNGMALPVVSKPTANLTAGAHQVLLAPHREPHMYSRERECLVIWAMSSLTAQNLEVMRIDVERNLIAVKGSVPGSKGSLVFIRPAAKG